LLTQFSLPPLFALEFQLFLNQASLTFPSPIFLSLVSQAFTFQALQFFMIQAVVILQASRVVLSLSALTFSVQLIPTFTFQVLLIVYPLAS